MSEDHDDAAAGLLESLEDLRVDLLHSLERERETTMRALLERLVELHVWLRSGDIKGMKP